MKRLFIRFMCIGFMSAPMGHAQLFSINQTPLRYGWRHIDTNEVRLIVSDTFSMRYTRALAARFHELYPYVKGPYVPSERISVVLRNYRATSNGFVSLFPMRMELFPVAPTGNRLLGGHTPWFDLLTIHELRHVSQFAQLKANNYWLAILYGEMGIGLGSALTPRWLWEGDAVLTETRLTSSGRGRLPAFQNLFIANRATKRNYSYDKARFGSFKDPIPNAYVLGYFMMSYIGQTYGEEVFPALWSIRFRRVIRQRTGHKLPRLYNLMLKHVDKLRSTQAITKHTPYTLLGHQNAKRYTNFMHPVVLEDGSVWASKQGLDDVKTWICLTSPKQKYFPGPVGLNDYLSGRGRWIAWTELRYHPRFLDVNYSEIKLLDTQTGKVRRLGRRMRAMGVALSPDGTQIATVRYDPKGLYTLELWRVRDEKVLQKWTCDFQNELIAPRFNEEGTAILAIKTSERKQSIMYYPLNGDTEKVLWTSANETLSHPTAKGDTLLYTTNYSGVNEIHMLDIATNRHYALTQSVYGSSHARFHPKRKALVYQQFTPNGYRIVETPLDSLFRHPIGYPEVRALRYYTGGRLAEPKAVPVAQPLENYSAEPLKNYSRTKSIFHLHSWGFVPPLVLATDPLSIWSWSASMQPTTYTNTFDMDASVSLTYSGIAPLISLELRSAPLFNNLNKAQIPHQIHLNLRLPLWLTQSVFNQSLVLQTGWIHDIAHRHTHSIPLLDQMYYLASYRYTKQRAPRDILPMRGLTFLAKFAHDLPLFYQNEFRKIQLKQQLYVTRTWPHHVLWMRNSFEQRLKGYPTFTIPIARTLMPYQKRIDTQLGWSLNYTLPIAHPDLSVVSWLYIKRLSLNVFYDHGTQYFAHPTQPKHFYSTGIELWNTAHILRAAQALRSGIALFYNTYTQKIQAQFYLDLNGIF